MKKFIFLFTVFILLFRISSGQTNFVSLVTNKLKSKIHSPHAEKSIYEKHSNYPSLNSFWKPGRLIESSWDTLTNSWVFEDSVLYTYNTNGDITLETKYISAGPSQQTVNTYNANGKISYSIVQSWNGSGWDNVYQDTYTYNTGNYVLQFTEQNWNGSGWDNTYKYDNTYDANNNKTQELYSTWNTSNSAWENSSRYDYTYDANNNQTQQWSKIWNATNSVWEDQWRDNYTYTSNQVTLILGETWSGTSWDNSYKENFTYTSGVLTTMTADLWNGTSWDLYAQYINIVWYKWTGDLNTSDIQSYLEQDWTGTAWQDAYRENDTYDSNSNNTHYLYEAWQTTVWIPSYENKNSYVYDASNNMLQNIVQDWVPWMLGVRNFWKYDWNDFSSFSGIAENLSEDGNVMVYPNPSFGEFQVFIGGSSSQYKIEISNLLGEKIYSSRIIPIAIGTEIDLRSQDKGIYFYKVLSENKIIARGKFVIE